MNNYEIIPMEEQYINDVYSIIQLSLKDSWSLSSLKKELNNDLAKYILLKKENRILGFVATWIVADECDIMNVAVHPEFRGIGLGNILLDALIKTCKDNKVNDITLEVRKSNIVAQNLYKKYGFKEEGIRKKYYQDNNEDAVIMWKRNISATESLVHNSQFTIHS
jgi:[ribosomal protein S18]-alanine N-acetyltransferase